MYNHKNQRDLPQSDCILLVNCLAPKKDIRIKFSPSYRVAAWANGNTIKLPMWGRKYSIIAHEVAHITCKDHKTEMYPYSPHGPLFVSIVMEYYIAMGISSKNRAISSAIDMKVDYAWEPDDYRIQSTKHSLSSVGFDIK